MLEARIYKAQNQVDKAVEVIQASANRPNLHTLVRLTLARLAEELGQIDLAERLLRQAVPQADRAQNRLTLAAFLGRHGRVKEGVDLCEPLWRRRPTQRHLSRAR